MESVNYCEFQRHHGDLSVKGETGSVKGETKSANFWQGKVWAHRQLCEFLARESVNSSPILARQWWRHFRLSLSLSLSLCISLSLSHQKYLTHNIGSASALSIIPKTIGNWKKEIVREVALGGQTPPEKFYRSKSTNQSSERNERLPDLCFSICRFSQVVFIPERNLTHNLFFLFPIVFGINLIHFFDDWKKGSAAKNSIVFFCASIPCHDHAIWQR